MTRYPWHPPQTRWRYAFALVAFALAVCVWVSTRSEPEWWSSLLASFFALAALTLLIEQETRVDLDARSIVREGRLFGSFRVWLRRHPLREFTGVAMRRHSDAESWDTVFVGLRRGNRRFMAVCYFNAGTGQPSVEAERVARGLADLTGLPLQEGLGSSNSGAA